jgi:hypothetical protein
VNDSENDVETSNKGSRRAATRWEWERALRSDTTVPWHLKSFLLLIGTWMDGTGANAKPSAATLGKASKLSRQRVFELLRDAETTGWIRTEGVNGHRKERVPCIPNPSDTSDGLGEDPSGTPDGSGALAEEETRQMGLTPPSDGPDGTRQMGLTQQEQSRTQQEQTGGTLPPDPLRTDSPQAACQTDLEPEPDQSKTSPTQLDPESPVPSAAREVAVPPAAAEDEEVVDPFRHTGSGALSSIGTPEALAELERRKGGGDRLRTTWRRQRLATSHLDPETRAAVRADLEAQRRRAAIRVVADEVPPDEPYGDTG